jgi:uncharacterized protein (DUF488 family)
LNVKFSKTEAFSIGYAGKDPEMFVRLLKEACVELVVDVRALPLSRRRGFSKTALREHLEANGIEYLHLKCAGNPYRDQKNDIERCLALYSGYLDEEPDVLGEVGRALEGRRAALLCVEAEHEHCHRSILADRLQAHDSGMHFKHL